jgi:hypothetical protein
VSCEVADAHTGWLCWGQQSHPHVQRSTPSCNVSTLQHPAAQAREKQRKAEQRKANKAAAKAAEDSLQDAGSPPAAALPLPLPQGARGSRGGATASSTPAASGNAGASMLAASPPGHRLLAP